MNEPTITLSVNKGGYIVCKATNDGVLLSKEEAERVASYISELKATLNGDMNPDGLPVGLTISDDGNLLDWRGENYVKQSTLGSGTLTAEQVQKVIYKHGINDGFVYSILKDSFQAIADELNAMLGSGECENIAPDYLDFLCSKCGFVHYHSDENDTGDGNDWNHCPNCGKAVKR